MSSPFIVRLPGTSANTFVMEGTEIPTAGFGQSIQPNRSVERPGAWSTRPILVIPDEEDAPSAQGQNIDVPIGRSDAQSPISPSLPIHLIAPSPTESDLAVNDLANNIDGMDIDDAYDDCISNHGDDNSISSSISNHGDDNSTSDQDEHSGEAQTFAGDDSVLLTQNDSLLRELAYYRASAAYWQGKCEQIQSHVAMVCVQFPGVPN